MAVNDTIQPAPGLSTEIERTFLARSLPQNLQSYRFDDIVDIYIPFSQVRPHLRIRKLGHLYEITKKAPKDTDDASEQQELTIPLTVDEYDELATVNGKRVQKRRFYYPYENRIAEIDLFLNQLAGLVVVEFEFANSIERDNFVIPDFCLVDVTQEPFISGAELAGKSMDTIKADLDRYGYKPLSLPVAKPVTQ